MRTALALALLCATAPCTASDVQFNAYGSFFGQYTLWGTVDIDTSAGSVIGSDLHAGIFHFSRPHEIVAGGAGSQLTYMNTVRDQWGVHVPGGSGQLSLDFGVPSLVGYTGGPLELFQNAQDGNPASGLFVNGDFTVGGSEGFRFVLNSGVLTTGPVPPPPAHDIRTFTASGTFAEGISLGGSVTIDATMGELVLADLTHGLDHFVSTIHEITYPEIAALGPGGQVIRLPLANTTALVNFGGGDFPPSGFIDQQGNFSLISDVHLELLVPEPSSVWMGMLSLLGFSVAARISGARKCAR